MVILPSNWLAEVTATGPLLSTIGRWIAAYVLLSLSLALLWIATISLVRSYRGRRGWNAAYAIPPRTATLVHGFRYWQERGGETFVSRLESLSTRDPYAG